MSSDNHMNNSEKEVDEVDAALSDLEITLEGGKTSNALVRQWFFLSLIREERRSKGCSRFVGPSSLSGRVTSIQFIGAHGALGYRLRRVVFSPRS